MVSKNARATVARSVFVSGLFSLAAVAVQAPSWAARLAEQGYYADFELELVAQPQTVQAGSVATIVALVLGRGPDTAQSATVTLRGDDGLVPGSNSDCNQLSLRSIRCPLPEIAPTAQVNRSVAFDSDPDARGIRIVSGFISSELLPTPNNPGLEVDAIALDLLGAHATGIHLLNERPRVEPDLRLVWTFLIDNFGPSSLLSGRLVLVAKDGTTLSCTPTGNARCEGAGGAPLYLPPGGQLAIEVIVPALVPPESGTLVFLTLVREEGVDVGGRPDIATALFENRVFTDSFGD